MVLFFLAGLAEIGGGYLMWLWLREGRPWWMGLLGGVVLVVYGILPTLQPQTFDFARTYAAYGGVFIVLSLVWGKSWMANSRMLQVCGERSWRAWVHSSSPTGPGPDSSATDGECRWYQADTFSCRRSVP